MIDARTLAKIFRDEAAGSKEGAVTANSLLRIASAIEEANEERAREVAKSLQDAGNRVRDGAAV